MKTRLLFLCICLSVVIAAAQSIGYKNAGLGFQIGLVVVDNDRHYWPYDGYNDDINFGLNIGGHGTVNFNIGPIGVLQYRPNLDVWFGFENDGSIDHSIVEIALNFFDSRYYPPIPETISVRPFVGFGPAIIIDIYHAEWYEGQNRVDDTDTDADRCFNVYCGADFRISSSTLFFLETRGKFGDWDVFKLMCGFSFTIW